MHPTDKWRVFCLVVIASALVVLAVMMPGNW
jgi:hypothetical protein